MSKSSKADAPALSNEVPLSSSQQVAQMEKARPNDKEMEICTEIRKWDELNPDALGIIFKDLSLKEKLTVVPSVCELWGTAVCSPICWQEISLEQCCFLKCSSEKFDGLLRKLVIRSCGSLSKLVANRFCTDDAFLYFLADSASSLETLIIPGNKISDGFVAEVANRLTNITTLDLSRSRYIGPKGLEAFGSSCKNLAVLHYSEYDQTKCQDDEIAFAIASTMPNLLRLEVPSLQLTNEGLLEILSKCKKLESLNIRRCWRVTLKPKFFKKNYPNLKVLFDEDGGIVGRDSDRFYKYL